MLSSLKEAYYQHYDCHDKQNMDKPAHRVTAYQSQHPEYHEYHKDRPNHRNLLLLYDIMPHALVLTSLTYPSPSHTDPSVLRTFSIRSIPAVCDTVLNLNSGCLFSRSISESNRRSLSVRM